MKKHDYKDYGRTETGAAFHFKKAALATRLDQIT